MLRPTVLRATALLLLSGAVFGGLGCGSDSNCCTRTLSFATARGVEIHIAWGERSRHIETPNSAQSATIQFIAGGADGQTVSMTVDRPAGTAAVVQTVRFDQPIRVDSQELSMQFYTEHEAKGTLVGVAHAFVNINPDGSGADDIAVTGLVNSVTIAPGQTINVGETKALEVSVRDADNNILAVSPGSIFLTVRGGGNALEITTDGLLRGKSPGSAALVAQIDGKESETTPVQVLSGAAASRFTINWAARSRYVNSTASARSVRVTLGGASATGTDIVLPVINRHADPQAYSESVTIPDVVTVGNHVMTAQFYADEDGKGTLVGVAAGALPVNADGSGLDTFTLDTVGTVASVEVVQGQVLLVGETKTLNFSARDQGGNLLALSPGSAFWTQVEGDAIQVLQDGTAHAAASGQVKVRVSVDGKISEPGAIQATTEKGGINVGIF